MATGAAHLVGQRGQVQPDRPAFGPCEQFVDRGVVKPHAGTLQQGAGLLVVHGEVLDPELQHPALGAQQRHRQRQRGSGGQQQLRPGGQLGGQLGHQVQGLLVAEQFDMVKDQGHWLGHGRHRGRQPGHRVHDRGARPGQPANDSGVDRLDPIQGDGQVGQQQRRIIVALVDSDPGHRARLAFGPLGQQGRLAVPGGRDRTDHRHRIRGEQPIHQQGPEHDPRPSRRRVQLGLHQLQRRPIPGPRVALRPRSTPHDDRLPATEAILFHPLASTHGLAGGRPSATGRSTRLTVGHAGGRPQRGQGGLSLGPGSSFSATHHRRVLNSLAWPEESEHSSSRNVGMAAKPHESCRPRSTSRLGRAPTSRTASLRTASEPGQRGRRAAHLRSEAGRARLRREGDLRIPTSAGWWTATRTAIRGAGRTRPVG
jgi:hypothetical protein